MLIVNHASTSAPACAYQNGRDAIYFRFLQIWSNKTVDKLLFCLPLHNDIQTFHSCPPIMFFSHRSLIVRL